MKKINLIDFIYLQEMNNLCSSLKEESIFIPADLKLILSVTKYDNLFTLKRFTKDDQTKIKTFMQTTLNLIIKKEEREKYYGIFQDHQYKFMFVGGLERAMTEIINAAKKIASKNRKTKILFLVVLLTLTQHLNRLMLTKKIAKKKVLTL